MEVIGAKSTVTKEEAVSGVLLQEGFSISEVAALKNGHYKSQTFASGEVYRVTRLSDTTAKIDL